MLTRARGVYALCYHALPVGYLRGCRPMGVLLEASRDFLILVEGICLLLRSLFVVEENLNA